MLSRFVSESELASDMYETIGENRGSTRRGRIPGTFQRKG